MITAMYLLLKFLWRVGVHHNDIIQVVYNSNFKNSCLFNLTLLHWFKFVFEPKNIAKNIK